MSDLEFRSDPPPDDVGSLAPIPFTFVVWRTKRGSKATEETHEFECRPRSEVSGHRVTMVTLSADRGDVAAAAEAWRFFELVMSPDDLVRFDQLLKQPDVYVDAGVLIDASLGLWQEYAGRPTRPQRRSKTGQPARGRTSTAKRT